jgi:hypothetical protein
MKLTLVLQRFVDNSCREFHEIPAKQLVADNTSQNDRRKDGCGFHIRHSLYLVKNAKKGRNLR